MGLDIGAGAVKVVEISSGRLRSFGFALRSGADDADGVSTRDALRRALAQAAPRAGRAVVGLDAGEAIEHRFSLPVDLPAEEIDEQARLHAEQAAPYPVDEAAYDYVEETAGEHSCGYRLVMARSASVQALSQVVESAGLRVAAVDVTSLAVHRSLLRTENRHGALALIDGAQRQCRLTIFSDGEAVFRHSQSFGCRNLLERLRAAFGLSDSDARKALRDCARPGGPVARVRDLFLRDLARHAARAMQLHSTSQPEAPVPAKLFLWGGAALVHGACRTLGEELEMSVSPLTLPADGTGPTQTPELSPVLCGAYALARNDHA